MVGFSIAGREKSAAVWEPVCERRGQVRERDGKKGSKPGRMVRAPEGVHGGGGVEGEEGRNGGEERDERGGATRAANKPETRSAGKKRGKSWGSMDATPRGTTLSWILRSKPATA